MNNNPIYNCTVHSVEQYTGCYPEKTDDILQCHYWFSYEVMSEEFQCKKSIPITCLYPVSEIVQSVKAFIIVIRVHLKISTLFAVSHCSSSKIFRFGTQKKCPFPQNRGIPSKEVINTKIMRTFFQDQILSPEWRYPLNRGVPNKRFHCTLFVSL